MNCPPSQTKDGYEIHFGTNHVGHALLIKLLAPLLESTIEPSQGADIRLVFVSSVAHKFGPSGGIQFGVLENTGEGVRALYGQSKLANLIYARELVKRHTQWTAVSVHPGTFKRGVCRSRVRAVGSSERFRRPLSLLSESTSKKGLKCQLWAATAKDVVSGEYDEPVGVAGKGSALSQNRALGEKLWDWTEKDLATVMPN
ncbi:hypothetical protein N8I77_008550 [Diaporthe amygdali]|uniref:Uncharacterized protein n=1 Tax=Phomopsis amygdali TaxID=1214568 RepID=A0AAD9SF71_PHOAM|nr:hypothetical protein N8I77_008550 [Diaporthe amygdali]